MHPAMRRFLTTLLCAVALAPGLAAADGRRDHDRARAALEAGEILPLAQVLERVGRSRPGQVLEVELERERDSGLWVYELKLLQPGGTLVKLHVDARTAAVLRTQERR